MTWTCLKLAGWNIESTPTAVNSWGATSVSDSSMQSSLEKVFRPLSSSPLLFPLFPSLSLSLSLGILPFLLILLPPSESLNVFFSVSISLSLFPFLHLTFSCVVFTPRPLSLRHDWMTPSNPGLPSVYHHNYSTRRERISPMIPADILGRAFIWWSGLQGRFPGNFWGSSLCGPGAGAWSRPRLDHVGWHGGVVLQTVSLLREGR